VSNQTIEVDVDSDEAAQVLKICVESGFAFHAVVKGQKLVINITGF
jgi:hypothetical protein